MKRLVVGLVVGLAVVLGFAAPAQAHFPSNCTTYLQGALAYSGSYWYSPQATVPAGSSCGNVAGDSRVVLSHVTDHYWAPVGPYVARVRVYPVGYPSYVGDWFTFAYCDVYHYSGAIATGVWGGMHYRVEFQTNPFPEGAYFYAGH